MLNRRVAACLLLFFTVSACGHLPTAPTATTSGQWEGTIESPADGLGTIALTLTQTGLNVEGSVRLSQNGIVDAPGTLTGTLATASRPTTMQYNVTYEYGPFHCQGTFSGTLNVGSREMEGSFNGQNCVQTFAGTLRATKSD
jgi:hypothetical protein